MIRDGFSRPLSNDPSQCLICGIYRIIASEWSASLHALDGYFRGRELWQVLTKSGQCYRCLENISHVQKKRHQRSTLREIIELKSVCRENTELLESTLRELFHGDLCHVSGCQGCLQYTAVVEDYRCLLARAQSHQQRIQKHLRIFMSIISVDMAQKSNTSSESLRYASLTVVTLVCG